MILDINTINYKIIRGFLKRSCAFGVVCIFLLTSLIPNGYAQSVLPISTSPVIPALTSAYTPILLKAVKVFPNQPFRFDFIVNEGESNFSDKDFENESDRLIKYFLAALTIPEQDLWVNLSPYEQDRIIPDSFAKTEMGRDLLAQDYILKQISSALMTPESDLGDRFWSRIRARMMEEYGSDDVAMDTFNKVWIVPEKAVVYENGTTAYVTDTYLKVMLEKDYLAITQNSDERLNEEQSDEIGSEIIKEIILPELEHEVNYGQNFVKLRQVYHSLILANWYKKRLRDSILASLYVDQNKVAGIDFYDQTDAQKIYTEYVDMFKEGVYDIIQEEYDPTTQSIVARKYFSGGFGLENADRATEYRKGTPDASVLGSDQFRNKRVAVNLHRSTTDAASLSDRFLEETILRVMGRDQLPDDLNVEQKTVGSEEWIEMEHTKVEPLSGTAVNFRYRIVLTDEVDSIELPERVSLNEVNEMRVPKEGSSRVWNEEFIQNTRYALRRLMIADPLNGRFSGKFQKDPYQVEAVDKIAGKFRDSDKAMAIMATATGKTVVAFESMDKYLDEVKARGETPGPVVFMVNNNIILSEAEQKLHQMFPGKYSSSRVFGGSADYTGDIIFATPGSLVSRNRIEGLLAERNIGMVIFDEVHHLPAEQSRNVYRRMEEESVRNDLNTKFLGLTATEVRPDRASVIALFERDVVFEYPVALGQRQGALADFFYINGDKGYPTESEEDKTAILPGDPNWDDYKDWRYSQERYPDLLDMYKAQAAEVLDKRGLILAPNIEAAQSLAAYFRKEGGIAAVSLTGADRSDNPTAFENNYQAWRTGEWPEGVETDDPIPQVVVGVDIFKEGVDVPAINLVMLWADTNSIIEFMQGIGRGLRIAPFKTHLTIIDTVGLYRKLTFLHALGNMVLPEKELTEENSGVRTKRHGSGKGGESFVSADVTKVLTNYLENVPMRLIMRYETYANIPIRLLLETLDPWLALQMGFYTEGVDIDEVKAGVENFYQYVSDFAERLHSGEATAEDKIKFRHKCLPALISTKMFEDEEDFDETLEAGDIETTTVYNRIVELLNRHRSGEEEISDSVIGEIFPEFTDVFLTRANNRSKNLRQIRQVVFRTNYQGMGQELVNSHFSRDFDSEERIKRIMRAANMPEEKIEDAWSITNSTMTRRHDEMRFDEDFDTLALEFQFLEGSFKEKRDSVGQSDFQKERAWKDSSKGKASMNLAQEEYMYVFVAHPTLFGKITLGDLELEPNDFLRKLRDLGLAENQLTFQQVINRLRTASAQYDAVGESEMQSLEGTQKSLLNLFNNPLYQDYFSYENMTEAKVDAFMGIYQSIKAAQEKRKDSLDDSDRLIMESIKRILENMRLLWEIDVEDIDGLSLEVKSDSRKIGTNLRARLTKNATNLEGELDSLSIYIRQDSLGGNYLVFSDEQSTHIERYYNTLTTPDRNRLLNAVVGFIEKVSIAGENMVTILPQASSQSPFFSDLFEHILKTTDLDILGPFSDTALEKNGDEYIMNYTLEGLLRSRVKNLNLSYVNRLNNRDTGNTFSFPGKIRYIYRILYDYKHNVLPVWGALLNGKLRAFTSSDQNIMAARDQLIEMIDKQVNKDVTGPRRMALLKRVFALLNVKNMDQPLSENELKRAYLYLLLKFAQIKFDISSFKKLAPFVDAYSFYAEVLQDTGYTVNQELWEDIGAVVNSLIDVINPSTHVLGFQSEVNVSAAISSLNLEELTRRINDEAVDIQRKELQKVQKNSAPKDAPPYIIQIEDGYGDEVNGLAIWVEQNLTKAGKPVKGDKGKPTYHWDRKHAEEVRRSAGEQTQVTVHAHLDLPKQKHRLCPVCEGIKGYTEGGMGPYGLWDDIVKKHEQGELKGMLVDGEGNLQTSNTEESSNQAPTEVSEREGVPKFGRYHDADTTIPLQLVLATREVEKSGKTVYEADWDLTRARGAWGEEGDDFEIVYAGDIFNFSENKPVSIDIFPIEDTPEPQLWKTLNDARNQGGKYTSGHDVNEDFEDVDASAVGGIDLTSERFNLDIQSAGDPILFNLTPDQIDDIHIKGLVPVIINVTPVTNLPLFLSSGASINSDAIQLSLSE